MATLLLESPLRWELLLLPTPTPAMDLKNDMVLRGIPLFGLVSVVLVTGVVCLPLPLFLGQLL